MNEDLQQLCERLKLRRILEILDRELRRAREDLGCDLTRVSGDLKIRRVYLAAIEEGLKVAKNQCIVNSSSAEEERLALVPPLANSRFVSIFCLPC